MKQSFGIEANAFTGSLLSEKIVNVRYVTKDRYGRTIGIVYVEGNSVSKELVKTCNAWVYDRYCKKDLCEKCKHLGVEAKQSKTGLWSQADPVELWEYRKRNRK